MTPQELRDQARKLMHKADELENKSKQSNRFSKLLSIFTVGKSQQVSDNISKVLTWFQNLGILSNIENAGGEYGFILRDDDFFLKKYYVYCYWDGGSNGAFCTEEEAKDNIIDSKKRKNDEAYDCRIFDIENNKEVYPKIKMEVTFI